MILPWKSLSRPGEFLSRPNRAALPNPTFASDSAYRRAACASQPSKRIFGLIGVFLSRPNRAALPNPIFASDSAYRRATCASLPLSQAFSCTDAQPARLSPFASNSAYRRATCASQPPMRIFGLIGEFLSRPGEFLSHPGELLSRPGEFLSRPNWAALPHPIFASDSAYRRATCASLPFRKHSPVQTRNLRVSALSQAFACTETRNLRVSVQYFSEPLTMNN